MLVLRPVSRVYCRHMITFLITPSTNKWYLLLSASIFTVVAIAHFALIILQMPAVIGGYEIPYEVNGLVVVVLGYLATRGFMAAARL